MTYADIAGKWDLAKLFNMQHSKDKQFRLIGFRTKTTAQSKYLYEIPVSSESATTTRQNRTINRVAIRQSRVMRTRWRLDPIALNHS